MIVKKKTETDIHTGLHESLQPCSRAARKWRENEEMERKWGSGERLTLYISSFSLNFLIFSPFPHSLSISSSFSSSLSISLQPGCKDAASCATLARQLTTNDQMHVITIWALTKTVVCINRDAVQQIVRCSTRWLDHWLSVMIIHISTSREQKNIAWRCARQLR